MFILFPKKKLKDSFGIQICKQNITKVLSFCVKFRELSHLKRDLSETEKKITVVASWVTDKMTTIFIQNDNFDHFK